MTDQKQWRVRSRFGGVVALFLAFVLVASACGDDDDGSADDEGGNGEGGGELLSELQEEGSITIGIANEVPYGYQTDDGEVTGQAPEVAKAVLAELGIENVDAQVVDFGALIPGLETGQFDMIAAGMFITPERAEQIIFSDPDYCVSESMAVPEGNPAGLTDYVSVADNPDVTLAVLSGAVNEEYAANAGIPESQIELFADVNAQYDALVAGRVDAVSGTFLTVQEQVNALDGFEALPGFLPVDEEGEPILGCGGYGFVDQDFRDAFNDVLKDLQEDGTVAEITTGFGFAEEDVETAAGLTVEDLTAG